MTTTPSTSKRRQVRLTLVIALPAVTPQWFCPHAGIATYQYVIVAPVGLRLVVHLQIQGVHVAHAYQYLLAHLVGC